MDDDRTRWENRYATRGDARADAASAFLRDQMGSIPVGLALDLACGEGRNAIHLARHGFTVEAVDISRAGLRRLQRVSRREQLPIRCVQADLDSFPLPADRYAVALNIRFLNRPLWPALKRCVRPLGLILFETFTIDQAAIGHPRNPAYLLAHEELLRGFDDFEVLTYEERLVDSEGGPAHLARLLARRPAHWQPR